MTSKTGETGRKPLFVNPQVVDVPRISLQTASEAEIFFYKSPSIKMYFHTLIHDIQQGFWGFTHLHS